MRLVLLSILILTFEAHALDPIKSIEFCREQIKGKITQLQSMNDWQVVPATHPETFVYRGPTQKLGQWIEIKINKRQIDLLFFDIVSTQSLSYTAYNCDPKLLTSDTKVSFDQNGFSDLELANLVNSSEKSMIYIWNPAAAFSVKYFPVYKRAAEKRKIKIVTVLAPEADIKWAQKDSMAKKQKLSTKKLSSLELIMRGGNHHYPSVFFVGNKTISKRLMGGLEKDNVDRFFEQFLKEVK